VVRGSFFYRKCEEACAILEPFMGSGTTGVAAVKVGRKFIDIEEGANFLNGTAEC
jgi:DNA modification methylase